MEGEHMNRSSMTIRTPPASHHSQRSSNSIASSNNPGITKTSGSNTDPAKTMKFICEDARIACNECEIADKVQKIRCGRCKRWWHVRCGATVTPESKIVKAGEWICVTCKKGPTANESDNDHNVTRIELAAGGQPESTLIEPVKRREDNQPLYHDPSHVTLGVPKNKGDTLSLPLELQKKNSTSHPIPPQKNGEPIEPTLDLPPKQDAIKLASEGAAGSNRSRSNKPSESNSAASHVSALYALMDEELEINTAQLRIDTEEKLLEAKLAFQLRRDILAAKLENVKRKQEYAVSGSHRSLRSGVSHTSKTKADTMVDVSSKVGEWLEDSRVERPGVQKSTVGAKASRHTDKRSVRDDERRPTRTLKLNESKGFSILNPNVTVGDFVNSMVRPAADDEGTLSKDQYRARQVLTRDLPEFDGNPMEWPSFAARFAETTRRCGYSEVENLDRLSRCLKGSALAAVRSELHKRDALASVVATLRMLFGRPEVVYGALVENIRRGPAITDSNREQLVVFSMSVKTLCDTLQTAELQDYMYHPLLIMDLIEKLPEHYRIMWGNYVVDLEERGTGVNLNSFNVWLRKQAEIYSATHKPKLINAATQSKTGTKPKRTGTFQGAHVEVDEEVESHSDMRTKLMSAGNSQGAQSQRNVVVEGSRRWKGWCHLCLKSGHYTVKCPVLLKLDVDQRWEMVQNNKLCIKCLGKHFLRDCGSVTPCGRGNCERSHHTILHGESSKRRSGRATTSVHEVERDDMMCEEEPKEQRSRGSKSVAVHTEGAEFKFQILPVILADGGGREVVTYAFLDNGSEITMVNQSLADKLRLKGPVEKLRLKWSNDVTRVEDNSRRVQLMISDMERSQLFCLKNVRTVDSLSLPTQSMDVAKLRQFEHLRGVPIERYSHAVPEILIGLDNYQLLMAQETREGTWHDPVAVRTRIGWTVYGNTHATDAMFEAANNTHCVSNDELKEMVDVYFSLENIGIVAPRKMVESVADSKARQVMERVVKRTESGRYTTKLLWKDEGVTLPDSFPMALSRLKQFERKMEKQGTRDVVNQLLREYHEAGYLKELTQEERYKKTTRTWYLPMFTVENPNKPGKVRLVWDAAATVQGTSLNDQLYVGPDLLVSLVATLFKFRERCVAVGGDIQKMFHQVAVDEDDQDAQRCLWRESSNEAIRVSRMTVMTFGAACSPTLAQYVKNVNAERYRGTYPRAVEAITGRHYVDDYLDSFSTVDEAKRVLEEVVEIHESGGFKLCGLVSNSDDVVSRADVTETGDKLLTSSEDVDVKVLGMWWNVKEDVLQYRVNDERVGEDILAGVVPTKRQVLRTLMLMFDPLGLIGYINLKGKLVLKAIWRRMTAWDETIHSDDFEKWTAWLADLSRVSEIIIPRWYFSRSDFRVYDLHVFVDAGEEAAAAVVYVVGSTYDEREVALITSKTKIGPNKPTSIPRMELQAAVIGARLGSTVREQHSIKFRHCTYWTDSRNVLCWIRSPKRFKVYVAHRIGEIRETTSVQEWRYVPTAENPADLGTKWFKTIHPVPDLWLHGPRFLQQGEVMWPEEPDNLPPIEEELLEVRCHQHSRSAERTLSPDVRRFSSYTRLLRTQVQVLRFFYWGRRTQSGNAPHSLGVISKDELHDAETYLIRQVQQEEFGHEYTELKQGESLDKSSILRKYTPFVDPSGLVRCRSRLQNAEYLTYDQRNLIILPRKHPLTSLIVMHEHERNLHQNHSTVLNELKQRFIIPALRALLKSIRGRCWMCRRRALKPEIPEMSPLPMSRMAARMRPFTYTGVDYFGPILVKHGRRTEKKWGAIFTCLTTRAIHLELASSLSSDSFLLVLRCFVSRRGVPNEMFCDNGTNFHGAEHELRKVAAANCEIVNRHQFQNIKWNFNPPYAPHMGGAWERLIRSVKAAMKCLISERIPSDDLVRAILAECEMMVNSRPLTYVDTSEDSLEALTPNHFLLGTSSGLKPIGNMTDDPGVLRHEWKRQQLIVASFWRRFVAEYLPEISQRSKWFDKVTPLSIGDVVAITHSDDPGNWQLGRIIEVVTSKDGGVRQAVVKTANGTVRRPSSKLAVLISELKGNDTSSAGGGVLNETGDGEVTESGDGVEGRSNTRV